MSARGLMSHTRDILCWFSGKKVSYIIPMYFAPESKMGTSIEVCLDLANPVKHYVLEREGLKTYLRPVLSEERLA